MSTRSTRSGNLTDSVSYNPPRSYKGGDYTDISESSNIINDRAIKARVYIDIRDSSTDDDIVYDSILEYLYDDHPYHVNNVFRSYEIFVYGSELSQHSKVDACRIGDITHTLIRLTDNKNRPHTIEWGVVTSSDNKTPITHSDRAYHYTYNSKSVSWFGCRILYGPISKNITFEDVARHASLWQERIGKGGSYPRNCRGYVDSWMASILGVGTVNWPHIVGSINLDRDSGDSNIIVGNPSTQKDPKATTKKKSKSRKKV